MPKKKTTTTVEEDIIETPEEKEIDYKKDIENKTPEQIITETPEEKEEEKVEEVVEDETEEVEFDPEKLKQEAVEEAEKKLLDRLRGETPEETKENRDEYQEWAEKFAESHGGNPPNWKDAMVWMEERAIDRFEKRQEEKAKEASEKQQQEQEAKNQEQQSVNAYVDKQLEDLYAANKLPKVKNMEDEKDTGVIVRRALIEKVMSVNAERVGKGLPTKTIKEVFYEDFKSPVRQPAGADAPISAGHGGASGQGDGEEINYVKDVRDNRLLNSIFRRRG